MEFMNLIYSNGLSKYTSIQNKHLTLASKSQFAPIVIIA